MASFERRSFDVATQINEVNKTVAAILATRCDSTVMVSLFHGVDRLVVDVIRRVMA